jgi:hypothetical protein
MTVVLACPLLETSPVAPAKGFHLPYLEFGPEINTYPKTGDVPVSQTSSRG